MNHQTMAIPALPPFPNNRWPVILYPRCMEPAGDLADAFLKLFRQNGWGGAWVNGVYPYHHFHADAHEVLGCASGWVKIQLGGPEGEVYRLSAGDAVLLPAGTGHKRLEASSDFSIVGAYPPGQSPDLQRGDQAIYQRLLQRVQAVPAPQTDPVFGKHGPAVTGWSAE